jgi:hypothetical protein
MLMPMPAQMDRDRDIISSLLRSRVSIAACQTRDGGSVGSMPSDAATTLVSSFSLSPLRPGNP